MADYLPQEGEWVMVVPLAPAVKFAPERKVRGLLVLLINPQTEKLPANSVVEFEEKWIASKFADWTARLLEGQWLRESNRRD